MMKHNRKLQECNLNKTLVFLLNWSLPAAGLPLPCHTTQKRVQTEAVAYCEYWFHSAANACRWSELEQQTHTRKKKTKAISRFIQAAAV